MGIDVYMRWDNQTAEEERAQYTGFCTTAGAVGYLREAYHGEPYATMVLVPEGWQEKEARIPAALLRKRLSRTLEVAKERARKAHSTILKDDDPRLQSYRDFVALYEAKEKAGLNPRVFVSY